MIPGLLQLKSPIFLINLFVKTVWASLCKVRLALNMVTLISREKTYDDHHLDSKRGVHQLVLLPLQVAELSIEMAKKCLQMILDS